MTCEFAGFAATKLHIDFAIVEKSERMRGELTSVNFAVDIARHFEEANNFQLTLRAKFSEHTKDKVPLGFQVEASVTGIIKVPADEPADKVQRIAEMNGVNMLYGTLRGIILNATGIFPSGPMLLRAFVSTEILDAALKHAQAEAPPAKPESIEIQLPPESAPRKRKRHSPAEEGVKSAQRVAARVIEEADPAPTKRR